MHDMKQAAERFTGEMRSALGDRLRSVVLHGSVARGEAVPGVSDVNLLVLVDAVDAALLRRLAPLARRWLKKEHALPLVLTWDEWAAASDAFAIETADMLDAREVVSGEDPLIGVTVRDRDLRLQAERELRGKLIHLREGTLASADKPEDLGRLVLTALPSVATYLRAALRLAGRPVPDTTAATLSAGAELVDADADRLGELWRLRERRKPPKLAVDDPRATAVHDVLARTADHVDTLAGDEA
ncbi:MAG: nucleotidyltransferase domain-containing protein [Gemmatimonadota bacterium]